MKTRIFRGEGEGGASPPRWPSSRSRNAAEESGRKRRDNRRRIWRQLKAPTQAKVACVRKRGLFCQCNPRICYRLLTLCEDRSTFTQEAVGPLLSQIP